MATQELYQLYSTYPSGRAPGKQEPGLGYRVAGESPKLDDLKAFCQHFMADPVWAKTFGELRIVNVRTRTVVASYPPTP
jgi:hypothetical protein